MLLVFIVLVILFATVVFDNIAERSILYPPFVFNTIWFLVVLIYAVFKIVDPGEMDTIHPDTLIFIALFNICFFLGGLYVHYLYRGKISEISFRPSRIPEVVDDIVLVVTVISLVLAIFKAKEITSGIEAPNFYIALRSQLSGEKSGYGILEYFLVFGLFASLYRLFTFTDLSDLGKKARLKFVLSILISFAFLVLSTARTSIFLYFIAFFIIIYLKGQLRSKYIRRFLLGSFVAFIIVGIVLNKGGSLAYSFGENILSGLNHLLAYFEGPVLAFDRFLNSDFTHTYGQNTFRFFFALFYELGITRTEPMNVVKEWIYVPYPTNVYTVFYPYIKDFGVVVCGIIIFLFGLVHAWLFYRSRTSGNHFKMKTAFSYYPLLMVFFQDQYFTLLSQWIQLWFYSLIILYIPGKYLFIKKYVS